VSPAGTLFGAPAVGPADVVVAGIPFDAGNGILPGARSGPTEIRLLSQGLGVHEAGLRLGLRQCGVRLRDRGDVVFAPGEPREWLHRRVAALCGDCILEGAAPLLLGGDHSVSFAPVERMQAQRPLAVLWVDAHTDTAGGPGEPLSHKNVARRLLELPRVLAMVQVGFRGYTLENEVDWPLRKRTLVSVDGLRRDGAGACLAALPPGVPLYVSVDIDVLDPAYAPGTASPVPGGLRPGEVVDLLRGVAQARSLAGADLVEVNPARDAGSRTAQVACALLGELIRLLAPPDGGASEAPLSEPLPEGARGDLGAVAGARPQRARRPGAAPAYLSTIRNGDTA
jgi:agmatinase